MPDLLYKELSYSVIGAAMEVHKILGQGFLESVYQAALATELEIKNIPFQQQIHLPVTYKNKIIGEYIADYIVDEKIIIEIKAVSQLNNSHQAQAMHYLAATGMRLALLINFGETSLQYKRIIK